MTVTLLQNRNLLTSPHVTKNELVSLLAKGQYPIICVKSFSLESGYLSVLEYDYNFSVNEVINEERF